MRKKSAYVWSLVAALMMTACSSDQNDADGASAKTGTFELSIKFDDSSKGTRAGSTAIPTTSWSNIKQIQFILYDGAGKIAWSAIEKPSDGEGTGATRKYTYATVPADTYTLVAVANAQSGTDAIVTTTSEGAKVWSVNNVYLQNVANLAIKHKVGSWSSAITGTALTELSGLTAHTQPSEVFMGYATGVVVSSAAPVSATLDLKREVSLMRVRLDQKTYADVVKNVDFLNAGAALMLYNLPEQMGIQEGNSGGVKTDNNILSSVKTNVLSAVGAYSDVATNYLDGNFGYWKDVMVFPNNNGRTTNTSTGIKSSKPYFIVICGIAKAGHYYADGNAATVGAPVFWYGQINEVFTPNNIREVDVILQTGGLPKPPPGVVEYGGLNITVNTPQAWGSVILTADPIEL